MPAGNKDVFTCGVVRGVSGEGMPDLEGCLCCWLRAGRLSVVKEGAIWESFKFKMFLRESQGMMPVTLLESGLGVS